MNPPEYYEENGLVPHRKSENWFSRYFFTCDPDARPEWVKWTVTVVGVVVVVIALNR